MKIKELIKELQNFDPELLVFHDIDIAFVEIDEIKLIQLGIKDGKPETLYFDYVKGRKFDDVENEIIDAIQVS